MTRDTDPPTSPGGDDPDGGADAALSEALSEALSWDNAEDLYENAPCGYVSTLLDGTIVRINATLLDWIGRTRDELVGHARFVNLLTAGGRLYHETHFAPLLTMQGEIRGVALDLRTASDGPLPVLVTSVVKADPGGRPALIRSTIFDARDRRSYERELLRARREAEHERERLQRLTATLQRTLLPPTLPPVPGLEIAAHYRIASPDRVGGDFYDLFPLRDDRWGFFLGDVCGKGADAAAVTSLTRYTLRAAAVYDDDPVAVLGNLNAVLDHEYQRDDPRFATVLFGLLTPDADGCTITLAGGGHPPALLLRADGSAEYRPTPGGQLVGVFPDAGFVATSMRLTAGDTLLLYTDGLTEARIEDPPGGRYGDEALLAFATATAPCRAFDVVEAVVALIAAFGAGLEDDVAVLALGVPPRP